MKKNIVAIICAALVAVAFLVPAGLQGLFNPKVPATEVKPAQTTEPQAEGGTAGGAVNAGGAAAPDDAAPEPSGGNPPDQPEYVPGEILVGLADGVTADQLNARLADLDYVATRSVSEDDVTFGYVKLQLADGVTVEDANARITSEPLIEAAQPNYVYHLQDETPEDANYSASSLQAGGDAEGVLSPQSTVINDPGRSQQWALNAIHAYEAWDTVRVNGSITVAVLDSGVNKNHADLQGRVMDGYNAINDGTDVTDNYGHGTHVAGIIVATANNNKGVAGVSYNAKVYPVKVMEKQDTDTATLAKAMDHVSGLNAAIRPKIINISIGTNSDWKGELDTTLKKAIDAAHSRGMLIVYAAANTSGADTSTPWNSCPCDFDLNDTGTAGHPASIAVINVRQSGSTYVRTGTSNFNKQGQKTKTLSAPGKDIYSTTKDGSYGNMSGTSMAAPCVAGTAALVFAANPDLTAAQVKSILETTAQDLNTKGWDNETGYGMIDAAAAVQKALTYQGGHKVDPAPTISGPSSILVDQSGTVTIANSGASRTWTWESSSTAVATVAVSGSGSSQATVTGKSLGTVTITAKSSDDIKLTLEVNIADSITGATIDPIPAQTYTGGAIEPSLVVKKGGKTLVKGVDYTVAFSNNTNVGNAKATVTGKGKYAGSLDSVTFSIVPASLGNATVTVSDVTYTGAAQAPSPTVKVGNRTLVKDTDYTVAYSGNRTDAGTATVTVTGKGNYKDSKSQTFAIKQANLTSMTLNQSSYAYSGSAYSPSVIVYGPKNGRSSQVLKVNDDYTLTTPSGRTAKGSYVYTAYGTGNYTGSVRATLTITAASLSSATVSMPVTSVSYTGSALKPAVTVKLGGKTLANGVDYTVSYSNNVNVGTGLVTITGKGNYSGTRTATFKIIPSAADASKGHGVQYRTHVQNVGWQGYVRDGAMSGTSGRALRLEGINISLANHPYSGSIRYRTHVQNIGWQGWRYDGAMSGTSGQSLRLEAIRIELTGQMAKHYDVYYRVHAQNVGWMAWAKNGESAGTAGYAYRLEGIQIVLRPKGSSAPTPSPRNAYNAAFKANQIQYRTHVQDDGWQSYVSDGATAGTSGRGLRLEGINIKLGSESGISGGVEYRTHVQNIGWQGWRSNGAMSGTSGQALRLEAIQIRLTGNAAKQYDIYYRVHSQNIGWMGWAKNGAPAGTAGYAYRLEAIQIKLVPKGGLAPGTTAYAYRQR